MKPACPTVVRDDCTAWDPQIDAATPTVVVASKSAAGDDLSDVVVTIDGANLSDSGSGLASAIDPGSHLFRFEHAGSQAVVRTVVIREGEKRRLVQVTFENATKTSRADGSQRAPFTPSTTTADGTRPSSAGPPVLTWVLGGAGVAALGAFAVLGLTGLDGYHALQNECGKTRSCTPSEIHGVRTQLWIADALGIAGVLAVGTAAWLWIATPSGRIAVGPQSIHFAGSF